MLNEQPNAWNSGLRVNIRNTVDTSKIQKLARQAACNILVGFPSGEEHVPTFHKNKEGEYKGYNGENIEDVKPQTTEELARELSYGTATIPARPFLEEGIASKEKELSEALKQEAAKVMNGGSANWNKVGGMAVGAIEEFVRGDHYKTTKPNSKKTIDYKGSDKPLIDGANLIQSMHYIVQQNGGK